jgi:hypothetical protein
MYLTKEFARGYKKCKNINIQKSIFKILNKAMDVTTAYSNYN